MHLQSHHNSQEGFVSLTHCFRIHFTTLIQEEHMKMPSVIQHIGLPFTEVQRLTKWPPGYTHAPNLWGHMFCGCPKYSRVMHATSFKTLTLTGLSASKDYLLVLCLNALYTPPAWIPRVLGFSLISDVVTGIILGPTLRGPIQLFKPRTSDLSLCWRGPMSIPNVDVRVLVGTNIDRNQHCFLVIVLILVLPF